MEATGLGFPVKWFVSLYTVIQTNESVGKISLRERALGNVGGCTLQVVTLKVTKTPNVH